MKKIDLIDIRNQSVSIHNYILNKDYYLAGFSFATLDRLLYTLIDEFDDEEEEECCRAREYNYEILYNECKENHIQAIHRNKNLENRFGKLLDVLKYLLKQDHIYKTSIDIVLKAISDVTGMTEEEALNLLPGRSEL